MSELRPGVPIIPAYRFAPINYVRIGPHFKLFGSYLLAKHKSKQLARFYVKIDLSCAKPKARHHFFCKSVSDVISAED